MLTRPLRDAEPADPHFGLPLRLVESTRAGLLWAYNAEHLQALHEYAGATLREGRGHHRSMFSRLPQWMKLARNRCCCSVRWSGCSGACCRVGSAGRWPAAEHGLGATDNPILVEPSPRSAQSRPSRFTAR